MHQMKDIQPEIKMCYINENHIKSLICTVISKGDLHHNLCLHQNLEEILHTVDIPMIVALIKACASLKRFQEGLEIHAEVARKGLLGRDLHAGNSLIDMYMKWGWLSHAQGVFDRLSYRDVVSWTALMAGYVNHHCGETALRCLEKMQLQGVFPNSLTYVVSLKACGCSGTTEKGREIHGEIERKGLLNVDCILGNALVDMYAKLGMLGYAHESFDRLQIRDVISWTSLITGYSKGNCGTEALVCFNAMQIEGVISNPHTYASTLKACSVAGALVKGKQIHAVLDVNGLVENPVIGSALVDMYINCESVSKAEDVHSRLQNRDVNSWNSLVTGYAKHGLVQASLDCLEKLRLDGFAPNAVTYAAIFRACGSVQNLARGVEVHQEILKNASLKGDFEVGSALVGMYARCGLPAKAQEVFNMLSVRDVRAWNELIAGYAFYGFGQEALKSFERMQADHVAANVFTFISVLNACGSMKTCDKLLEVHAEIARKGQLNGEVLVGNTLVDKYSKCGWLAKAEEVLKGLIKRDVVSWTTLIAGYIADERAMDALDCFEEMKVDGICPNAATYACVVKACGCICALNKGQEISDEAEKLGILESNVEVGSAVVDMYAKCNWLSKAQFVFDRLQKRDVVTWNALISGYTSHELGKEALQIYDRMRKEGVSPNPSTFVSILKACGSIEDVCKGQVIHADIDREGFDLNNLSIGNALLDMYAKCQSLSKAKDVFDQMPIRDVVTWNAMIVGYVNNENCKDALNLYNKMQSEQIAPDDLTFLSCLKACSNIGAVAKGKELHAFIARDKFLREDLIVGNALVEFYVKCGLLRQSQELFEKLSVRDVVSWNTMISGYAKSGNVDEAIVLYEQMREDGERPDLATFLSILNACSHSDFVDKAEVFFDIMTIDYGLTPSLEHYTCIIDLLGRSGHLSRAIRMLERMHAAPDVVVWNAVLDACQKWGSVDLARRAFDNAVSLDASDSAPYLSMCKIYASAGMLEDANRVEALGFKYCAGSCRSSEDNGVEVIVA